MAGKNNSKLYVNDQNDMPNIIHANDAAAMIPLLRQASNPNRA